MRRKFRLVRSNDFKRVRREGKSFAHPFFILLLTSSDYKYPRAGISISRAVGNAVTRNRLKRQIRAILNEQLEKVKSKNDFLIIVRKGIVKANFSEIKSVLENMFDRCGIV